MCKRTRERRDRQERPDKELALLKVLLVALPDLQELDLAIGRLDATQPAEFLSDTCVQLTPLALHSLFTSWSNRSSGSRAEAQRLTMINDSPFLQMKVGPENGLDQPGRLRRLKSLVFLELLHDVGAAVIA